MTVPVGKFRDRVEILEAITSTDDAGGETIEYVPVREAQVWIRPLRGKQLLDARQVASEVTHMIVGHYVELSDVTAKHRIRELELSTEFDIEVPLASQTRDIVELVAVVRA